MDNIRVSTGITKRCIVLMLLIVLIPLSSVAYDTPDPPERFYGDITINGSAAPNGTLISAWIDGDEKINQTTINGKYGYVPPASEEFNIYGSDGATIIFKIYDASVGTDTLSSGYVTQKHLSLNDTQINTSAQPDALPANTTTTFVLINWTDNPGSDTTGLSHYELLRVGDAGGPFSSINETPDTTQTTYNDTGRSNGVTYYYRLQTYDKVGNVGNATDVHTTINTGESTYIPEDPDTLESSRGNYWVNYIWSAGGSPGNVTNSFNVSMNNTWTNGTTDTHMNVSVGPSGWANISVWAWNTSGTGTLSTGCESDKVQAPAEPEETYIPPDPATLTNTTGNYWVNYAWVAITSPDNDNVTDSFNVCMNSTWTNETTDTFMNVTAGPSGWANITVWAYNASGGGTLSAGSVSDNVQAPAGAPNITSWSNDKTDNNLTAITVNESESVRFNATADQTITMWNWTEDGADQSNNFDNYTTSWSVNGTHTVSVNATNANGTSGTKTWTITVNDITPPASITDLQNTTYQETYISWTWADPADADFSKVMVYLDGTFKEDVTTGIRFYNATGLTADTEYEISTHTVDESGNINATWVNHTARTAPIPDTTPPASITDLQNTTYQETYISWTWADPADADFSKVMVYLDGTFKEDVTTGIRFYNATGLTADTEYEISTHTVDESGNINATWVNHTARTAPIPDTTPPASITDLQNTTYQETYINWTWTDPADADFSKVMVYLDETFKEDVTTGIRFYNATGLTADTEYEISTHTADSAGNINATWVNHTARTAPIPDTTPPASITDLQNTTYQETYINWTWADPADADFSKVMVYLDGTFKEDVTTGIRFYNATGLTADTEHEISTHTVDESGNINATWVNHTARTAPIPDTTPPASITDLQNTTYQETYISWTWADPADADFSKVMVYLDGTFKEDVTTGIRFYNATGLTADTEYEISTHTVDESGNINATWVNHTARTAPIPDTTAPASITDLQNTTYQETYISWTWADPADADFSKVMVYLDGLYKEDVLKEVQCYNATGLTADTEYEISTHTADSAGNINATWVNHTARTAPIPDTTPPASITDLQNTTYQETYINWTWADPADADFSKVMVYLDGTFKEDVTTEIRFYNATGLTADTEYEISTHTVDESGNINATWVNHTARTAPIPDTTPPASITDLQNTTYQETYISWTWADPADADFSKVMVYLDGTFKEDVTTGIRFYNATGLTADTEYEISTHTVDESGNINATWVNHTARTAPIPDTTPPASITDLQNTTYQETYINWTWTDPADADFSKVMVYLDGTFKEDVTTGIRFYNATGLTADTEYEISTHTADSAGNINATWVNHTARTAPIPDTTPPASITDLQNTTYQETYINWTWADPADADFSKVMVYLDGTFKEDVTTGIRFYNATGLTADTEYEISTHTVDESGNINATWVNHTARTAPIPDTTAPASITDLQNTTYQETYISWTWADPADADFSKVMVYLDGLYKEDVLKEVQCYNATGLTADTEYEISTHTADSAGNINATWVNHTARTAPIPDTTPPASITDLQNTTYQETYINWTWADPADADFSKVMVYLDGTFKEDVTTGIRFYNATGLTADTEHEISTHTVDESGNINATWVNHTARTAPIPDTTPPASITDLQNTTYQETYINWTWADPADADFSKVMVYLDGTFKEDVTTGIRFYNATGLTADTEYEISTHTADSAGNINATWVNHTARTAPIPDTTPPASITDLQNTTYQETYINWTWTDPADADFSKVMVYLDGTFKEDVTTGIRFYNATGLTADTEYEISTHTADSAGNINATWVNHTARTAPIPDTTPPASITDLQNTTYQETYINWTWADPADADFSKVMVYLDGTFKEDVTTGIRFYNATGLTADTEYEISTHTVDESGNINATWVNHTARTAPIPDTTPPASITDLQNTTYQETYINWTWADPADADFSKVMVYLDGTFKEDVTTGIRFYNATGLTADTEHEISTHTVDESGNINATWVNHTARTAPIPDTTPPASITDLQNTTYQETYINWTWTDPADADFSKVMVYLDGLYKEDVLKEVQCYNATGLTADTEHEIATRTADSAGNVNATWVNHTARTAPIPDTTPPASITDLQNTTYQETYINWTWTDPADADFSKVMVYLDGLYKEDVLKEVQCYNATGLTADTEHEIATRTADSAGNVNATWVNHTARTAPIPDTTPPASITDLQNTTYQETYINWTWADPADADFSKVMVYLDGTFKEDVTTGIRFYNATGLTADTEYEISTHTVDESGNINATWVNDIARTKPLNMAVTATPASVTVNIPTSVVFNVTGDDTPVSGTAVSGATVTLSGAGVSETGTTAADGTVTIAVNATSAGTITVTATKTGYTAAETTVTVTVGITVDTINVTPIGPLTMNVSDAQTFTATCYNGTTELTGITVTWASSNTTVGTIDSSGIFTAAANGTTNVTATAQGKTSNAVTVTVGAAVCPGDFTADGYVNTDDVVYMVVHLWGACTAGAEGDFTADGFVNTDDVIYLVVHLWGACP